MLKHTDVRELIIGEVRRLLLEHTHVVPEVSDQHELVQLGLTSLMFAELLIELESTLDVDPFQDAVSITQMRTVGDLIVAYQNAVGDDLVSGRGESSP